jgi:hypothetical protein
MRRPAKIDFFQAKLVGKDPQVCPLSIYEAATKHFARTERPSSNLKPIPLARTFVKGVLDLELSNKSILTW